MDSTLAIPRELRTAPFPEGRRKDVGPCKEPFYSALCTSLDAVRLKVSLTCFCLIKSEVTYQRECLNKIKTQFLSFRRKLITYSLLYFTELLGRSNEIINVIGLKILFNC